MHLTPRELDKLTLHQAGFLAQKRLARGLGSTTPRWSPCSRRSSSSSSATGAAWRSSWTSAAHAGAPPGPSGRPRARHRGSGRGDLPGRNEARDGHHPSPPSTATWRWRCTGASCRSPTWRGSSARPTSPLPEGSRWRPATSSSTPAGRPSRSWSRTRPTGPSRSAATTTSSSQSVPALRPAPGLWLPPRHSGGNGRALRAGRGEDRAARRHRRNRVIRGGNAIADGKVSAEGSPARWSASAPAGLPRGGALAMPGRSHADTTPRSTDRPRAIA